MSNATHWKPQQGGVVFQKYISELNGVLKINSLNIENDKDTLINWVNQPYAKKFWQLDGSVDNWINTYTAIVENPYAHSFVVTFNDEPIAQIDMYNIHIDELSTHIDAHDNDTGFHILMGPPREMQKGFSWYAIKCLQEYYFSFENAGDLYAEPDESNYTANRLAINTGFTFLKTIELYYKTANLYKLTREQFFK